MHEHRRPHAGAEVGRACGQEPELRRERVLELPFQLLVERRRRGERLGEIEAGSHDLEPEVVFLIDHQAGGLVIADVEPALRFGGHEIGRRQMPLNQVLALLLGKLLVVEESAVLHVAGVGKRPAYDLNRALVVAPP